METTRLVVAVAVVVAAVVAVVAARDMNALLAQHVPDAPNLRFNARRYPIIHDRIFGY
jgi:hypothetical protein